MVTAFPVSESKDVTSGVVQWLSRDEVKLVVGDSDNIVILKRIGSDLASPFKPEGDGPRQTGEGSGNPGSKHPTNKKPTAPAGQGTAATPPPKP